MLSVAQILVWTTAIGIAKNILLIKFIVLKKMAQNAKKQYEQSIKNKWILGIVFAVVSESMWGAEAHAFLSTGVHKCMPGNVGYPANPTSKGLFHA